MNQLIILYIVLSITFVYVFYKLYKFIKAKTDKNASKCDGCALKDSCSDGC